MPNVAPSTSSRLPAVYLPHGGGPWPFVDTGLGSREEQDALLGYLERIASLPRGEVRAILVVSAHWEERVATVMTHPSPPMLYDYSGFPPASYSLSWPAPSQPEVAARVVALLRGAGFETAEDSRRGYDHGTFVPLKVAYPAANVPVVQLSLLRGLDPARHLAMGRALAPLRDEGVYVVGSGMSYHNLRALGASARPASEAFDAWLARTATAPRETRDRDLAAWATAPMARAAHPREEHLIPLMVVAGAAGDDVGRVGYSGTLMGVKISAYHYG